MPEITEEQVRETLETLNQRKRDYGHTFFSPSGMAVLEDLIKFCRATESCYHDDPRKHAVAEGRREVWLRIQSHLYLSYPQLYTLYSGGVIVPRDGQPEERDYDPFSV